MIGSFIVSCATRGHVIAERFRPTRCLPALLLAVSLLCATARAEGTGTDAAAGPLPAPAGSASGGGGSEQPGGTATPSAEPASPTAPALPPATFATSLGKRADSTHDLLERGILVQVLRLDDFFGKANSHKELATSYLLRWRNSLRLQQGGGVNLGSDLRARLDLSKISERLQLAISGEDKPDPLAPSLPEDPGNPGFDRTFRNGRVVNTELRYELARTPVTDFFLGVGMDLVLPPRIFARARYQRLQRFSELTLGRFAETIFAKTPDDVGETTELSLEHSLNPETLLRWANSATVSKEIGALEWGSEISLLREFSPRSAGTVTGGVYGNTSFKDWVNNYRILARYRRNFLRSWLFYELEPQVAWPRSGGATFPTTYSFTGRVEVVFQGKEQRPDLP